MATPERRRLLAALLLLDAAVIGLPWAAGGQTPLGRTALVLAVAAGCALLSPLPGGRAARAGLLCGVALIGLAAAHSLAPDRTIQALLLLATYLLAGLLARDLVRRDPGAEAHLLAAILAGGILVAAGGMLPGPPDAGLYAAVLTGPFGYPNAAAGFLLLSGGAGLALAAGLPAGRRRGLGLGLVALTAWGLCLTRSRGALLAIGAGGLIWATLSRERWWPRRRLWLSAALLAAAALLVALAPRLLPLLARARTAGVFAALDPSFQWRWHILGWTWQMIREHPWLGVGPGAFPVALLSYQRLPYISGVNPHNAALELMAEYGLPAAGLMLGGFCALLGTIAARAGRLPPGVPGPAACRTITILAVLAAAVIHGGVDLLWSVPVIPATGALLAGIASACLPPPAGARRPGALARSLLGLGLVVLAGLALCRYASSLQLASAQSALAAGDGAGARAHLAWALRLNPTSFAARERLVHAHLAARDPRAAVAAALEASRLAPKDPNSRFLAGAALAAAGDVDLAATEFRLAAEGAPATQLRFHAGLVEALSRAGRAAEARQWFARAHAIFPAARVLEQDARCLAPGDRYLLAHLHRILLPLHVAAGDLAAAARAEQESARLAMPDARGICAERGRLATRSPELALAGFWGAPDGAGAQQFLAPELRPLLPERPSPLPGSTAAPRARLTRIMSLAGGEREVSVEHELLITDGTAEVYRCASAVLRFTAEGWLLAAAPRLFPVGCRP